MSTIKFCFKILFRAAKGYSLTLVGITVVSSVTPFLSLFFASKLVQFLSNGTHEAGIFYRELFVLLFFIFLLNLLNKIIEYLRTYASGLLNELVDKETDLLLMNKAASLDLSYFDSNSFYNEVKDASLNKFYLINTTFYFIDLLKSLTQLFIAILSLAKINWLGSILLSLSIIPNVIFLKKQYRALYDQQRDNLALNRKKGYLSMLTYEKSCAMEIKLYQLGSFLVQKYKKLWEELFNKKRKTTLKYTVLLSLSSLLPELVTVWLLYILCRYLFMGVIDVGGFLYYQGVTNQVLAAMLSSILVLSQINDGRERAGSFVKFLNWENHVLDCGDQLLFQPRKIEFKNVSFRYGDALPYVLKDVNISIYTNQFSALVGSNGCGKTTLVKLLLRFYDPSEGEITIDGVNIKNYTLNSVRNYFSIMFQDYGRYAFTVLESTCLSQEKDIARRDKVIDALKMGGAYDFVQKYPEGLDTYITRQFDENGMEPSGGQWQSIALARSFFREDAGMFIFDEPSSALDAEAETALLKRIEQLRHKKGAVVISHRLSNMVLADVIYVLEDGCIIEQGTHQELLALDGKYARLFRLQAEKYGVKDDSRGDY